MMRALRNPEGDVTVTVEGNLRNLQIQTKASATRVRWRFNVMSSSTRSEISDVYPTVPQEVARLSASPEMRSAFHWFRSQELEMARIPAPPFGEGTRAAWLAERFRELGLDDVRIDDVGNVFGIHPGFGRRYIALSAHIDTVFPANTPLNIRQQGSRIYGPGVSDNGAGVAALLGIAALLRSVRMRHAL